MEVIKELLGVLKTHGWQVLPRGDQQDIDSCFSAGGKKAMPKLGSFLR